MECITDWRTSTRTQGQGQCVEVGFGGAQVGVRDTKHRSAGYVAISQERWREFLTRVKRGDFDC